MLSNDEKKREMQQWGIIFNLTRQRKSLTEMQYSNESRTIEKMLEKIEDKIQAIKFK